MGLWDVLAQDQEWQNAYDAQRQSFGFTKPGSSALADAYEQQAMAGTEAAEEAYNPAEDLTPVGLTRKLGGKLLKQAALPFLGGAGWVSVAPEFAKIAKKGLTEMEPQARDLVLRSTKMFGWRPTDAAELVNLYGVQRAPSVAGFNEHHPLGSMSASLPGLVEGSPEWGAGHIGHEWGHGIMRLLNMLRTRGGNPTRRTGIPGVAQTPEHAETLIKQHHYDPGAMPEEMAANALAGEKARAMRDTRIFDQKQFNKFLNEKIEPAIEKQNDPLAVVDFSLTKDPKYAAMKGRPRQSLDDFLNTQAKSEKYAKMNAEKERMNREYRERKFVRANPDEPLPDTISDMEKAFNYALKQYTPMHTDNPILKEAKQKRLQSFMDWWERSDETARRDFVKALPTEEAPVAAKAAPYRPEPSNEPFAEEAIMSERDRLRKVHNRLRSQSGKLRGVR